MVQKLIHPTDTGKADREREAPDDNFFLLFLTSTQAFLRGKNNSPKLTCVGGYFLSENLGLSL